MDLNLDFDFLGATEADESVFLRSRERTYFDIYDGADILRRRAELPGEGESLRAISYAGGFSSCSVVLWVAGKTKIDRLHISTLRVGKKEISAMEQLHEDGKLGGAHFVLSGLNRENDKKYDYDGYFRDICTRNGFSWTYAKNHSKVILCDTRAGKFTIETSSNFNENPKIEQFCITRSVDVYNFYLAGLFGDTP